MAEQLPSGRWRARVYDAKTRKNLTASKIIGGPSTFEHEWQAKAVEDEALKSLRDSMRLGVTVGQWWTEWTTSPLWERPAESTNIINRERTERFARNYWHVPLKNVDSEHVADYLKNGKNVSNVPSLRTMFNDARKPQAGALITANPFASLGLKQSRGRKDTKPPSEEEIWKIIEAADELTPPSFAAYVTTAIFSAMRPGELDGLPVSALDFTPGNETIHVRQKWNPKTRKIDPYAKHQSQRHIAMTAPVRERLLALPRESAYVFTTIRGNHYTPSSRAHHWNRVRCTVGLPDVDLYTATRHFFGWYCLNILKLKPQFIALQFGHDDGGELITNLYGHPDAEIARNEIRAGFANIKRPTAKRNLKAA